MMSGFVRGAVSGLGLLNIVLGIWEIVNFRKTVRAFAVEWEGEEVAAKTQPTVDVHDNGSEEAENRDRNAEDVTPD